MINYVIFYNFDYILYLNYNFILNKKNNNLSVK